MGALAGYLDEVSDKVKGKAAKECKTVLYFHGAAENRILQVLPSSRSDSKCTRFASQDVTFIACGSAVWARFLRLRVRSEQVRCMAEVGGWFQMPKMRWYMEEVGAHVLTMDYRGFGDSQCPPKAFTACPTEVRSPTHACIMTDGVLVGVSRAIWQRVESCGVAL